MNSTRHAWLTQWAQQTNTCCLENKQTKTCRFELKCTSEGHLSYLSGVVIFPFHWNVQSLCTCDVKYYWLCPMRLYCKILNLSYILYNCIYIYFMQMLKICKTVNQVNKRQIEGISVGFHWSSFSRSSLRPLHFSDLLMHLENNHSSFFL